MTASDQQFPLGYSGKWIALGIVSSADIQRDQQECAQSDDPYPEHYRWRAFSMFLAAHPTLSPETAHELYELGATEADYTAGGSMMAAVLRHPNCPSDLLRLGLTSGRPHLQRLAAQRLNSNENNS